ncbi:hypothetical protein Droror1_Dr00018532 [Drosera rotundifolia]
MILTLTLLLAPLIVISTSNSEPQVAGVWEPIKNITDPHVIEIAKLAIVAHSLLAHTKLQFEKVLEAKKQESWPLYYWEKIQVLDGTRVYMVFRFGIRLFFVLSQFFRYLDISFSSRPNFPEANIVADNEIGKREKVRLKEMQRMKKQKVQEILDKQNAIIDADMNIKGKGRLKYLLQQTGSLHHAK